MPRPTLLFVYNADSGLLNALKDMAHKALSPGTYPCGLCATTYGPLAMRSEWKAHVAALPYKAEFLHRDEFRARHRKAGQPLPAILLKADGTLIELLGPADLPLGQTVPELIAALDAVLATQPGQRE